MRQSDATSKDWTELNSIEAFEGYVRILLQKCGMCEQTVPYKPFSRQGYWCQRLQIPAAHRDQLYRMGGLSRVQIRAVRSMTDPAESGLEVLRIDVDKQMAVLAAGCKLSGGLKAFSGLKARHSSGHQIRPSLQHENSSILMMKGSRSRTLASR